MTITPARNELLDEALARHVPESRHWHRFHRASATGADYWVEHPAIQERADQHLVVLLRGDGAVQVEWHVTDKPSSPFELFMPCDEKPAATVIDAAARFVADVLREDIVLGYRGGVLRGGRQFLKVNELLAARRANQLDWTVSWRGTHTWQL